MITDFHSNKDRKGVWRTDTGFEPCQEVDSNGEGNEEIGAGLDKVLGEEEEEDESSEEESDIESESSESEKESDGEESEPDSDDEDVTLDMLIRF